LGRKNTNKLASKRRKLYNPAKTESDCESSKHYLLKAQGDLKKDNCILLLQAVLYIMALIRLGIRFSRYIR
jgi:hypothetical protein